MEPIRFTSQSYWIGEKPVYLNSGEFHYFRVPKADWHTRMRLFKEAGGNCLATYIPWLLHEPEEGTFCFGEKADWLDLEGFLQAAMAEGLYVIARPGPYQYSELMYDGLPGWLCENYPDLLAKDYAGMTFRASSVSYIHPLFMEKVRSWFDVVCPIITRYTVSNGGPVAFTQLDNEMAGIHVWFGSLDYNPVSMGFGKEDGRFTRFLAKRYKTIAQLNKHYGSTFIDYTQVPPPEPHLPPTLPSIRRKKDYYDFYLGTIAEYASILAKMIRDHGIDTPLIHNSGSPEMNADFLETAAALGKDFLLGSDHYYSLDQSWPQNNPTPQYASRVFLSLEMLRLMGYPPTVLEMPGGSLSDWPPITPIDALAAYMTNLAFGMKGHNYYIFTGGPNPPGAGNTTDIYDYGASISAEGEIRPLYQTQKTFGQFILQQPHLMSAERAFDCRIGLDFEYNRAGDYWDPKGDFRYSAPQAWKFLRKGVLSTALCASLSPAFVDLASDAWVEDTKTPLIVVSSDSMAAAKQERLVRFLQAGGNLLILPVIPVVDDTLQPCTLLAEYLGSPHMTYEPSQVERPLVQDVFIGSSTPFFTDQLPSGAQIIGKGQKNGLALAWEYGPKGGGRAIILGLSWDQAKRDHERMLTLLLKQLGLSQKVHNTNPNVWVTMWEDDQATNLFLMNLFTSPMETEITLKVAGKMISAGIHTIPAMSVKTVEIKK